MTVKMPPSWGARGDLLVCYADGPERRVVRTYQQ